MSVLLQSGMTPPPSDEEIREGIRIAANLIAAAPDLLAALKAVMEAAEKWSPAIDQGRAAIAKAEGRDD